MTALDPRDTPVLLLGFNRPELMRELIGSLREVAPTRLYLAVDGPRADRPDDVAAVTAVRAAASLVDWPCDVHTRFLEVNAGCGRAVSGAISWFFEHEDSGVILEDDVRASPDFHRFAAELLARYADDSRVWSISGICPDTTRSGPADYRFTSMPMIWGWATWRRAWSEAAVEQHLGLPDWQSWLSLEAVASSHGWSPLLTAVLRKRARDVTSGTVDTWDLPFAFRGLAAGALHVLPTVPLTTNVGVDTDPTHAGYLPAAVRVPRGLPGPLHHPSRVDLDLAVDRAGLATMFEATPIGYLRKARRKGARLAARARRHGMMRPWT